MTNPDIKIGASVAWTETYYNSCNVLCHRTVWGVVEAEYTLPKGGGVTPIGGRHFDVIRANSNDPVPVIIRDADLVSVNNPPEV